MDDGPPRSVDSLGRLTVVEGRHRVRMTGPVEETREIDVRSGFFDRWFGSHPDARKRMGEAQQRLLEVRQLQAQNSPLVQPGLMLRNAACMVIPVATPSSTTITVRPAGSAAGRTSA